VEPIVGVHDASEVEVLTGLLRTIMCQSSFGYAPLQRLLHIFSQIRRILYPTMGDWNGRLWMAGGFAHPNGLGGTVGSSSLWIDLKAGWIRHDMHDIERTAAST
jgi:hypothetical protein